MRVLYTAIDQTVPGPHGGASHVAAVAEGLAARGHDVTVLAAPGTGPFPAGRARWHALAPPGGRRMLRLTRTGHVTRLARRWRPDVVIERYYNFGGEGMLAARAVGAATVLEVNAPVVDYPGSPKRRLDRLLGFEPMRRWRTRLCRWADRIVTPCAAIVPAEIPRTRVIELEWGADTTRFHPDVAPVADVGRVPGGTVAIFAGAFRPWHGAIHLVDAIGQLRRRGRSDITALFVGDGPELPRIRRAATGVTGITFAGAVAHEAMPAWLAAADVGVAPFDVAAHPALSLGFYWSPLKLFEYMAAGLPVVTVDRPRLRQLVGHDREGVLYDEAAPAGLAEALAGLASPAIRTPLGHAARARAVRDYGWDTHCAALDDVLQAAVAARRAVTAGAGSA